MSESAPTIGVLGIQGSYTYAAGRHFSPESGPDEIMSYPNFTELVGAVKAGDVDAAALPVLNSISRLIENPVLALYRSTAFATEQAVMQIDHHILAHPELESYEDITSVHSKPEIFDQCSVTLNNALGHANRVPESDSATSARLVAKSNDPTRVALGSRESAEVYGLKVLNDGPIANNPYNQTKFWKIEAEPREVGGSQITPVVLDVPHRGGALAMALMELKSGEWAEEWMNLEDIGVISVPESTEDDAWADTKHIYLEIGAGNDDGYLKSAIRRIEQRPDTSVHVLGSFAVGGEIPS